MIRVEDLYNLWCKDVVFNTLHPIFNMVKIYEIKAKTIKYKINIDLFKNFKNIELGPTITTLNENIKKDLNCFLQVRMQDWKL